MKRRELLAAGAAATIAIGSLVAVTDASAAGATHTVTLHGKALQHKQLGRSNELEVDVLRKAGTTVGYSTESSDFGGTGDKVAISIALKGGILFGHYTFPITSSGTAPTTAKGVITGGIGVYSGDSGTIKVVATASSLTDTITYH